MKAGSLLSAGISFVTVSAELHLHLRTLDYKKKHV